MIPLNLLIGRSGPFNQPNSPADRKHGFKKGEKMGRVLKQIEQDWINNDFDLKENFINKYLDFKN